MYVKNLSCFFEVTSYNPTIIYFFIFMSTKTGKIVSQIMAILALIGIVLSVIGTAWLWQQPVPTIDQSDSLIMSWEQNIAPVVDVSEQGK